MPKYSILKAFFGVKINYQKIQKKIKKYLKILVISE